MSGVTVRLGYGCLPLALETFRVWSMRSDSGTPTTAGSQPFYQAYMDEHGEVTWWRGSP